MLVHGRLSLREREVVAVMDSLLDGLIKFYEPEDAMRWMFSEQPLLSGRVPYELIRDRQSDEVARLIAQLRDGAYHLT